jgi:hypothetical protein
MRSSLLLISATLWVAGCSVLGYEHRRAVGQVELYSSDADHSAEVRVPYQITGRGNVHDPFSYSRWQFMSADWITIDNPRGVSTLSGRRVTPCPSGYNKSYTAGMVKGIIDIRPPVIRIDLMVPTYDKRGAITAWRPYEFNGEWTLIQPSDGPFQPSSPESGSSCEAEDHQESVGADRER